MLTVNVTVHDAVPRTRLGSARAGVPASGCKCDRDDCHCDGDRLQVDRDSVTIRVTVGLGWRPVRRNTVRVTGVPAVPVSVCQLSLAA